MGARRCYASQHTWADVCLVGCPTHTGAVSQVGTDEVAGEADGSATAAAGDVSGTGEGVMVSSGAAGGVDTPTEAAGS
jgi:hypothetical protein